MPNRLAIVGADGPHTQWLPFEGHGKLHKSMQQSYVGEAETGL